MILTAKQFNLLRDLLLLVPKVDIDEVLKSKGIMHQLDNAYKLFLFQRDIILRDAKRYKYLFFGKLELPEERQQELSERVCNLGYELDEKAFEKKYVYECLKNFIEKFGSKSLPKAIDNMDGLTTFIELVEMFKK